MDFRGFVPEPSGRGTVGIIWNCLATLFLSTWTSMHVDIDTEEFTVSRIVSFMIMGVLLPELGVMLSIMHLREALRLRQGLRSLPASRNVNWGAWSLRQSFLVVLEGVEVVNPDGLHPTILKTPRLLQLAANDELRIDDFPDDAQIKARSRSDWLSKSIAICQVTWFAATIVSRLALGLSITLIEDVVSAYVFCGFLMMLFWWRCPQDVQETFQVRTRAKAAGESRTRPTAIDEDKFAFGKATYVCLITLLLSVFVGIHLAAWNYPFPTTAEAWSWRGTNVAALLLALVTTWALSMDITTDFALIILLPYTLCRFAVCGLAFAALRHTPAGAFETPNWATYWAHIEG
jgi:hypothetical protein